VDEKARHIRDFSEQSMLIFLRHEEISVLQILAGVRSHCGSLIPESVMEIIVDIRSSVYRVSDGLEQLILELVDPEGAFKKRKAKECQQEDQDSVRELGPPPHKRRPRFDTEFIGYLLDKIQEMERVIKPLGIYCAERFPPTTPDRMMIIDNYIELKMSLGELCLVVVESVLASAGVPVGRGHLDSTWAFLPHPCEKVSALD
jgi:hypothetical protein